MSSIGALDGRVYGNAERGKSSNILFKCAGVCRKVFMRRKLGWIDEDREDGEVILG